MKKITFLAALLFAFGMNAQDEIFYDGFESYEDFTIEDFGGWTQLDLDGGTTWGSEDMDFPNESYVGAGIIFNMSAATCNTEDCSGYDSFAGDKGLYFFASGAGGTAFPNDDYAISPQISLAGASGTKLSLFAKVITDIYGPDLFSVGVSTTGNAPGNFTMLGDPINPPTDYDYYEFDLSDYDGEDIYIAIHCTTDDGFILMIDEFTVEGTLSTTDHNINGFSQFYSAQTKTLTISANDALSNISLFNVLGQQVISKNLSSNNEVISLASLKDGVYIANVVANGQTATFKIVKR